jgi:hypothetical protein
VACDGDIGGTMIRVELWLRTRVCRFAASRSMKVFPLNKGGGAKRLGVVRSVFPTHPRQPPEGFAITVASPSFPLW